MRKSMKKGMCMLAMSAMLATSVTGCGSKTTEATTAAEATTEATTETTTEATTAETTTAAEETTTAAAAAGELTEEEQTYIDKTEEIGQVMAEVMTKAQEDLAKLDPNDVEGAKKLIDDMKAPFIEFAAIEAPEKFAAAQAKYKSGCEAMVEYLDICLEAIEMGAEGKTPTEEEAKEFTEKITSTITTATMDLTEAATLLAEASGVDAEALVETESEAAAQ